MVQMSQKTHKINNSKWVYPGALDGHTDSEEQQQSDNTDSMNSDEYESDFDNV